MTNEKRLDRINAWRIAIAANPPALPREVGLAVRSIIGTRQILRAA